MIQIDSPSTVAGFLQRLGRTGRRAGTIRNCLFLVTDDDALLRACALLTLWREGFVEPVEPPALPFPVLGQQLLASVLQEAAGIEPEAIDATLDGWLRTAGIGDEDYRSLLDGLFASGVLYADERGLGVGDEGERRYGAKHFLELFSVFNSPPLVTVNHGLTEVGQVHPTTFRRREKDQPFFLTLGGRGWRVTQLDLERKRAWVEPVERRGKSRWLGSGPPMHFELAQAAARVLHDGFDEALLSKRAREALVGLRSEFGWVRLDATRLVVEADADRTRWWTFAGDRYNQAIAARLRTPELKVSADGLGVTIRRGSEATGFARALEEAIRQAQVEVAASTGPEADAAVDEDVGALKFAELVPRAALVKMGWVRFHPGREAAVMVGRGIEVRVIAA
ncbi:MAG: hypothetical protein MUE69_33675 [Myxococcota bacterium]|nr:hypothetical protein [Myxococcota bacterium]